MAPISPMSAARKAGADSSIKDKLGQTVLHTAALSGSYECVAVMLDQPGVVVDIMAARLSASLLARLLRREAGVLSVSVCAPSVVVQV